MSKKMDGSGRFSAMPWTHAGVRYLVSGHWSGVIHHARDSWDLPGGWVEFDVESVDDLEFTLGGVSVATYPGDMGALDAALAGSVGDTLAERLAVEFRGDMGQLEEWLAR